MCRAEWRSCHAGQHPAQLLRFTVLELSSHGALTSWSVLAKSRGSDLIRINSLWRSGLYRHRRGSTTCSEKLEKIATCVVSKKFSPGLCVLWEDRELLFSENGKPSLSCERNKRGGSVTHLLVCSTSLPSCVSSICAATVFQISGICQVLAGLTLLLILPGDST